ncbi:MAG TPA: hypothetical protein VE860_05915 [Chthoniobacterales bacterium]|nr:hypothetical protein [Chthoniobacterales bacterium]
MNQFEHYVENLTGVWNSFQQVAFERAGLKAVFDHVRENGSTEPRPKNWGQVN